MKPEYFWDEKNQRGITYIFINDIETKEPELTALNLFDLISVDTNAKPGGWGRIGIYYKRPDGTASFRNEPEHALPEGFRVYLLLLGVQP